MDMPPSPIIPEVDFSVSATGITITSDRLMTPKFVPFDIAGRCTTCKSDVVEIDYSVTPNGVTIQCPRLKSVKYVIFDFRYNLPNQCVFRVRTRGRVFNIPYNEIAPQMPPIPDQTEGKTQEQEEEEAAEMIKK
jgi:hypothetical protein